MVSQGALTSGQRQRHPVDVAVHGVHDEQLVALGDLHGVGLDPQLVAVEDRLHGVPALVLHHRLSPARRYNTRSKHVSGKKTQI